MNDVNSREEDNTIRTEEKEQQREDLNNCESKIIRQT
jgi:hypothetical protein